MLEIDRADGLPESSLAAPTREGSVDLNAILGEVGIDLEIVWSDVLSTGELVDEPWPGVKRIRALMGRYRNVPVMDGRWHFYLLLGRKTQSDHEISMLFDPDTRIGAVVFVDP